MSGSIFSMKIIPVKVLKKNLSVPCFVDDEDYEILNKYKWRQDKWGHARSSPRKNSLSNACLMHRVIMKARKGQEIDHANGNKLDNRKNNLRFCSKSDNQRNKGLQSNNTSGYKGVTKNPNGKWRAQIKVKSKRIYLGTFPTKELAHEVYKKAAIKYHGEFARW